MTDIYITHVYVDPEGGIRACTVPVPELPTCSCKALKACKDSAIRFEDWKTVRELLGHGELKPDTFYPLQCEVEIVDYQCPTCGYKHSDAFLHLDHHLCKTPMPKHEKVARLIPEEKKNIFDEVIHNIEHHNRLFSIQCRACEIERNDDQVKQMPEHTCAKGPKRESIESLLKKSAGHPTGEESQVLLWKRALQHSGSKIDPIKWLSDNFTITRKP